MQEEELNTLRKANYHQNAYEVSCIRSYAHNLALHFVCCLDDREKESFEICEKIQEFCKKLHLNLERNLEEKMDKEIKKVKKHIDKDMNQLLKKDIKRDKACDKTEEMTKKKKK